MKQTAFEEAYKKHSLSRAFSLQPKFTVLEFCFLCFEESASHRQNSSIYLTYKSVNILLVAPEEL